MLPAAATSLRKARVSLSIDCLPPFFWNHVGVYMLSVALTLEKPLIFAELVEWRKEPPEMGAMSYIL